LWHKASVRCGACYRDPPGKAVEAILRRPGVSSLQISFREDRAPASHAMPPGGFRLAGVNRWNLGAGLRAGEDLKTHLPFAK
jgi:hypothetical protein